MTKSSFPSPVQAELQPPCTVPPFSFPMNPTLDPATSRVSLAAHTLIYPLIARPDRPSFLFHQSNAREQLRSARALKASRLQASAQRLTHPSDPSTSAPERPDDSEEEYMPTVDELVGPSPLFLLL